MGNRLFLLLLLFFFLNGKGKGECLSVPYVVVLGASMVDVGENAAAMPLRSSSEFPPFGLDYFPSPAARYSNGRLFIDFLTQDLGHGLLHPYLYSLAPDFSHGVNFASSGSTAYNSTITGTGENSGGLFSFLVQVDQLSMFLSAVKTGLKYPMDYCCGYAYNDTLCIACGGSAYVNAQIYKGSRCDDPSLYIYWDGMHPTESFGRHIANGILTGSHMIPSFRLERSCPYRDHSSTY